MRISEAVRDAYHRFSAAGIENPLLDAQIITAHCAGTERFRLAVDDDRILTHSEQARYKKCAARREAGEPVAYITGRREFYSLDFSVGPGVLIPRPETELLVDLVLYYAPLNGSFLDLCTGSGAVGVAVKKNRPDLTVHSSDIDEQALAFAKKNAARLLGPRKIKFYLGDLFAPVEGRRFNVIAVNPPYVSPGMAPALARELSYEPPRALFSDDEGAAHTVRIIKEARSVLADNGVLIIETDGSLRARVESAAEDSGFAVSFMNDYAGMVRVAVLKRQGA